MGRPRPARRSATRATAAVALLPYDRPARNAHARRPGVVVLPGAAAQRPAELAGGRGGALLVGDAARADAGRLLDAFLGVVLTGRELVREPPVIYRADEHREVEQFVWSNHAGNRRRPAKKLEKA